MRPEKPKSREQIARSAEAQRRALMASLDIPDTPSQRAGLTIREKAWRERSDAQAYRAMPWQGIGLTQRQEDAAELYADMCAVHRASPAPLSCLDWSGGGHDGREPTEAEIRAEREWWSLNRAVHRIGMRPSVEIMRVCWALEPARDIRALGLALDAVAEFFS